MNDTRFEIGTEDGIEGRRIAFADGGVVFIKGDPGDYAYVVASGNVEIRESGRVIETMEAGEIFGEMALIDSEPRSASAVAVGPTELIIIDPPAFERLIRDEPGFAMKVMRHMSRRLRATLAATRPSAEEMPIGIPSKMTG